MSVRPTGTTGKADGRPAGRARRSARCEPCVRLRAALVLEMLFARHPAGDFLRLALDVLHDAFGAVLRAAVVGHGCHPFVIGTRSIPTASPPEPPERKAATGVDSSLWPAR